MSLDLAVVTFDHTEGAEHAYADVLDAAGEASWTREIAFVEHHRHDRPDHVNAMVAAFEPGHGRVVRRHLSPEAARALEAGVTGSAAAASEPGSA